MTEEKNGEKKIIETNDLIAELQRICYTNTKGYRVDFERDTKIILSEAQKPENERNTLLWMSYPDGTNCLRENEVFMEGSTANGIWLYYKHQLAEAKKIAYAIKILGLAKGKVEGVLYELDFEEHCKLVEERAVPADYIRYIYERASIECSVSRGMHSVERAKKEFGELISCQWLPNDPKKHNVVLFTEEICRDGSRTALGLEMKEALELRWKKELAKHEKGEDCYCLRCGKLLEKKLDHNSRSRYAAAYICSECGMDEAMRSFPGEHPLNISEWAFLRGRNTFESKNLEVPEGKYLLTTKCEFGDVFKTKDSRTGRAASEVAYSRSDYDGYRWWSNWFLHGPKVGKELSSEIDGFMNALWAMPEFASLRSMKRASVFAELTSGPAEFNLYSETFSFYIWIRMNTMEKNYNLYVHFYRKDRV